MKIITKTATAYDFGGFIVGRGIAVIDYGETVSIGRSEYRKDELEITDREIRSKAAEWSVKW